MTHPSGDVLPEAFARSTFQHRSAHRTGAQPHRAKGGFNSTPLQVTPYQREISGLPMLLRDIFLTCNARHLLVAHHHESGFRHHVRPNRTAYALQAEDRDRYRQFLEVRAKHAMLISHFREQSPSDSEQTLSEHRCDALRVKV